MQRTQGSQVCFTGPIILHRYTPGNVVHMAVRQTCKQVYY